MNSKNKIITFGIITTLILLFSYTFYRYNSVEKEYIARLIPQGDRIAINLKNYEPNKKLGNKNLSKFLELINKKYENIALLAIINKENRLLGAGKNDKYITNNEDFDAIIGKLTRGEFKLKSPGYLVRYFNQVKFYLLIKDTPDGQILLMFPYKLGRQILTRLILEFSLIIILAIIFTTAFYLFLRISGKIHDDVKYNIIHLTKKPNKTENIPVKANKNVSKNVSESLQGYVFDFFSNIAANYSPESISLFVTGKESGMLEKLFELKGETFIKIDSAEFDRIDINNEIGEELKKSAIVVLDRSRKLLIPIIYRNSLLAAINMNRPNSFKGIEINEIKMQAGRIGKAISDYLLFNEVVVDNDTGLYSKTYFQMKYDELLNIYKSTGKNFSVILISIFDQETLLSGQEKTSIFKTISGHIITIVKDAAILCSYYDFIGLLIPETEKTETEDIGNKILAGLARMKVKIDKNRIIEIKPFAGLSSTDMTVEGGDPLQDAIKNLSYSRSKGDNALYSVKTNNI